MIPMLSAPVVVVLALPFTFLLIGLALVLNGLVDRLIDD